MTRRNRFKLDAICWFKRSVGLSSHCLVVCFLIILTAEMMRIMLMVMMMMMMAKVVYLRTGTTR